MLYNTDTQRPSITLLMLEVTNYVELKNKF